MSSNAKLLCSNQKSLFNLPTVLYENRYSSQDNFSIFVCGGSNENNEALNDVYELKRPNCEHIKVFFNVRTTNLL